MHPTSNVKVTPTAADVLRGMLDKRRKWLTSCERTLELLTPEWELFEARAGHDIYVARLYADHFSEARTHRKEIAALETALDAHASGYNKAKEAAAQIAWDHKAMGYMSERERQYCHGHGDEIAELIEALTPSKDTDHVG